MPTKFKESKKKQANLSAPTANQVTPLQRTQLYQLRLRRYRQEVASFHFQAILHEQNLKQY